MSKALEAYHHAVKPAFPHCPVTLVPRRIADDLARELTEAKAELRRQEERHQLELKEVAG